jgi:hypothetical protein
MYLVTSVKSSSHSPPPQHLTPGTILDLSPCQLFRQQPYSWLSHGMRSWISSIILVREIGARVAAEWRYMLCKILTTNKFHLPFSRQGSHLCNRCIWPFHWDYVRPFHAELSSVGSIASLRGARFCAAVIGARHKYTNEIRLQIQIEVMLFTRACIWRVQHPRVTVVNCNSKNLPISSILQQVS